MTQRRNKQNRGRGRRRRRRPCIIFCIVRRGTHWRQPPQTATMNIYAHDLTLLDFNINFSDPVFDSLTRPSQRSSPDSISVDGNSPVSNPSPPRYRHDGSSPLPLGMDWSPPPRKWVCHDFDFNFDFDFFSFLVPGKRGEGKAGVFELVKRGIW